jgi:biopolymer transport protein ExbB
MTFEQLFTKGGPVVWILAGYSVIALTIVIERILFFVLSPKPSKGFEETLRHALEEKRAPKLLQEMRGPEATVMQGIIDAARDGIKDLGRVASRVGSDELQRMERGFRTLGILGNTAPLLGLFGTITGMIKAFMVIEQAGGRVDAQALAGGIWEAMITTGVGLAVAIPILLLLHFLEGAADRRARSMHRYASVLVERLADAEDIDGDEAVRHREGMVHAL